MKSEMKKETKINLETSLEAIKEYENCLFMFVEGKSNINFDEVVHFLFENLLSINYSSEQF